jgi:hypothetical protein
MGLLSLLILLASATGVISQSFSEVPECAAECITDAILGTGCDAAVVSHPIAMSGSNEVAALLRVR